MRLMCIGLQLQADFMAICASGIGNGLRPFGSAWQSLKIVLSIDYGVLSRTCVVPESGISNYYHIATACVGAALPACEVSGLSLKPLPPQHLALQVSCQLSHGRYLTKPPASSSSQRGSWALPRLFVHANVSVHCAMVMGPLPAVLC